jgi:hypothetical protein
MRGLTLLFLTPLGASFTPQSPESFEPRDEIVKRLESLFVSLTQSYSEPRTVRPTQSELSSTASSSTFIQSPPLLRFPRHLES